MLLCIGCGNEQKPGTVADTPKKNLFISPDTLHLFYGVLPGMRYDPGFQLTDTIRGTDYQLMCRFISDDSLVTSAYLDLSFNNSESLLQALANIREHFNRFAQSYSASQTFDTWILPFNKRPLVEISLFQSIDKKRLSIEAHLKQSL